MCNDKKPKSYAKQTRHCLLHHPTEVLLCLGVFAAPLLLACAIAIIHWYTRSFSSFFSFFSMRHFIIGLLLSVVASAYTSTTAQAQTIDTTASRVGLAGMSFQISLTNGISINSFSGFGGGFAGKYWFTDKFALSTGLNTFGSSTDTDFPNSTFNRTDIAIDLSALSEFHFFNRSTWSPYVGVGIGVGTTVNSSTSNTPDNRPTTGRVTLCGVIGVEYFILPRISLGLAQRLFLTYSWANNFVVAGSNPPRTSNGRGLLWVPFSTNFTTNIYF
jgi:outer membrane protein W